MDAALWNWTRDAVRQGMVDDLAAGRVTRSSLQPSATCPPVLAAAGWPGLKLQSAEAVAQLGLSS